jgi:hypothetical protein
MHNQLNGEALEILALSAEEQRDISGGAYSYIPSLPIPGFPDPTDPWPFPWPGGTGPTFPYPPTGPLL